MLATQTLAFTLGPPRLSPIEPTRYDEKGRQIQFVESEEQKNLRLEFLHKREWAKRVTSWVNGTADERIDIEIASGPLSPRPMSTPADISLLQSLAASQDPDEEPYLFYSSSSGSTSSSPSSICSPLDDMAPPSPTTSTVAAKFSPRTIRRRIAHQRTPSLSAISEVPEGI